MLATAGVFRAEPFPTLSRVYARSSRDASTAYIKQAPGRLVQKRQAEPASDSAFAPPKESYSLRSSEVPTASKVVPAATSVSPVCPPTACFLPSAADLRRSDVRARYQTCPDGAKTRTPRSTAPQVKQMLRDACVMPARRCCCIRRTDVLEGVSSLAEVSRQFAALEAAIGSGNRQAMYEQIERLKKSVAQTDVAQRRGDGPTVTVFGFSSTDRDRVMHTFSR